MIRFLKALETFLSVLGVHIQSLMDVAYLVPGLTFLTLSKGSIGTLHFQRLFWL